MPENESAWNSDNQEIKKKVNQPNQMVRTHDRQWTTQVGLAEGETETQRWLWTTAVAVVGETPSLTRESGGKCTREDQASCTAPSLAPPPQAAPQCSKEGCPALGGTPKALSPYNLSGALRQRNRAQMKEQSKASERDQSYEDIANLSDGELKALVIKMLTELIELGQKMKKQMKDTQNEITQNI